MFISELVDVLIPGVTIDCTLLELFVETKTKDKKQTNKQTNKKQTKNKQTINFLIENI